MPGLEKRIHDILSQSQSLGGYCGEKEWIRHSRAAVIGERFKCDVRELVGSHPQQRDVFVTD